VTTTVTTLAKACIPLPGDPYELWLRGDLPEAMGTRADGRTRVEAGWPGRSTSDR
jgi:hypothetical protein